MSVQEECLRTAKLLLENLPAIQAYIDGKTVERFWEHNGGKWGVDDSPYFHKFLYRPKPKHPIGHGLAVKLMLDETLIKRGGQSVGKIDAVFRNGVRLESPSGSQHFVSFTNLMEYETIAGSPLFA